MRPVVVLLLSALGAALLTESEAQRCPHGWRRWRSLPNDCYFFSRRWYTWTEARSICKAHGGDLLTLRTVNEKNRLVYSVRRSRGHFFIGFNNVVKATRSADWVDGTKWQSWHTTMWNRGEPNNAGGKEFCGQMVNNGKLNDVACNKGRSKMICRRPRSYVDKCDRTRGWLPFDDKCYRYFEGKLDWRQARESCRQNEGDLLVVDSQLKLNIIRESVLCAIPTELFWLGLSDTETQGKLTWTDGSDVTVSRWARNQPRALSPGNTCTEVMTWAVFLWRTNDCNIERKYMCEKPQGSCPSGWRAWRGNCYQVNSQKSQQKTWIDAHNYCQQQGAQLIKIESWAEQSQVVKRIARRLRAGGIKTFYIGVSDKEKNGEFKWADGTDVRYRNGWANRAQPRHYPNKWSCGISLTRNRNAKWVTRYCFNKRAFVCKIPVHGSYTPPTPAPTRACYDDGWINFQNKCYLFADYALDWMGAQQECSAKYGANLVTIDSPEVQSFVSNNIGGMAHIGLNNRGRDSLDLRWVGNNQPLGSFLNWALWHPVLGVPEVNCVNALQRGGRVGVWRTFNCTWPRNFICEKQSMSQIIPASTPPTLPWSDRCGPGWIYDKNTDFCYYIKTDSRNFFEGQESCKGMGGELASIGSNHEQHFVHRLLTSKDAGGALQFWMGGNNLRPDAGWSWTDFSAFAFFNWNPGMPDSRDGANCVKLETSLDGRWKTDKCDGRFPYICKKPTDKSMVTVPSVTPAVPEDCTSIRMVSGDHYVQDAAMTASSKMSDSTDASRARIVSNIGGAQVGWQPASNMADQWIQVDFAIPVIVKGVVTKGMAGTRRWVSSYKVLHLYDMQSDWRWYSEADDGSAKVISGNSDSNSEVTFTFTKPFQARYIRLMPVTWDQAIGLRLDIVGCIRQDCREEAVVSGDAWVPDRGLTASSVAGPNNKPEFSRIKNSPQTSSNGGSWTASFSDNAPWIQADLGRPLRVRAVQTMGRNGANEWVTTYQVGFSSDGQTFTMYNEPYATNKIFVGNTDGSTLVTNYLKSPIVTRYVRLFPKAWSLHPSMRWEVLACLTDCQPISLLSGDHAVDDSALSASSSTNGFSGASRSRLYTAVDGNLKGAWSAAFDDPAQYIQVDLGTNIYVVGLATRGRDDRAEWVTKYIVGYSNDGKEWYAYFQDGERKLFEGNWDQTTTRKVFFYTPFSARYVRLYPQDAQGHISLRWEVYGCPGPLSGIHAGCYTDTRSDPDLTNSPILSPTGGMTSRICINHCFHQGYLFAGIKAGDTCRCGNGYGKHGTSKSCSLRCEGNKEDMCGGDNANSIYNTGIGPTFKRCEAGWVNFGSSCYMVSASRQQYDEGDKICHTEGAELVGVDSAAEMDFITSIVDGKESVWLGLNDRREMREYEWKNGAPVTFTNWDVGQPSNWATHDASCVFANAVNGRWSSLSCDSYLRFLCEKPMDASLQRVTVTPPKGCPRGWTVNEGNCYLVVYSKSSWSQAATNCRTMGSDLVRVMSRQEQVYIRSQMAGAAGEYWTDLSDTATPGRYTWSDGSVNVPYTNWARGMPDDKKGTCVAMVTSPSLGRWYDRDCGSKLWSVCKRAQTGATTTPQPFITPGADTPCPPGWLSYGISCFLVINKASVDDMLPWAGARADCQNRGAELASFHSQDELNYLWRTHIAGIATQFWIGLNSRDPNQGHIWSDFSPVTYTYWAPGEPNNAGNVEDCVEMYPNDGKWNDMRCDGKRNWICKTVRGLPINDLSTTAAPVAGGRTSCSPDLGWRMYDGLCYYFSDGTGSGNKDWRNADRYCRKNQGNLVSIHSQTQLNFVKARIRRLNLTSDSYWIGLNELDLRQGYKWSDKSPVDFINWGPNEPNDDYGNEPCIGLRPERGEWHNLHCAEKMGFICTKYKGGKKPAPPTDPTPLSGYCPKDFVKFRNRCFKIVDPDIPENLKTFDEARDTCVKMGRAGGYRADLASIDSDRDQAFVNAHLMDRKANLWIGLRQKQDENTKQFTWVGETPVMYTNWRSGQPDRSITKDGNCVLMDTTAGRNAGKWYDDFCLEKNGYICMTQPQAQIVTPPTTANPCPRDFVPWRKSCYLLLRGSRNWQDSRQYCSRTDPNAQLVTVSDPYEQGFVFSLMNIDEIGNDVWIGLSDFFNPGLFTWVTTWPVTFTLWGRMQPTRAQGGCVVMSATDGLWKDVDCNLRLPSICKVSAATPPPTPSPVATGSCPEADGDDNWLRFGRACFLFRMDDRKTYQDADTECVEREAQLTSVHSQEEHEFIASTANKRRLWVGFHKTQTQGFVWRDDSVVNFVRWNQGEPNDRTGNNNENCVELWPNGNWNDINCYYKRGYVCRRPLREERSTGTIPYKTPPGDGRLTTKPLPPVTGPTRPPVTRPPWTPPPRTLPPRTLPPWTRPRPTPSSAPPMSTDTPTGSSSTKRNTGPDNVNQVGVTTSGGEIAGIVILTLLLLLVVVGIFMLFRHTKTKTVTTQDGFNNVSYVTSSNALQLEANGQKDESSTD